VSHCVLGLELDRDEGTNFQVSSEDARRSVPRFWGLAGTFYVQTAGVWGWEQVYMYREIIDNTK